MSRNWPSVLSRFAEGVQHLVWPPRCLTCDAPTAADHFCTDCVSGLTTDHPYRCAFCAGTVGPHADATQPCLRCPKVKYAFGSAVRFGLYADAVRRAVLQMKQPDGELLAFRLGELWATHRRDELLATHPQVIVPVPLHWRRRWQRGYNQAEELARGLAATLRLPLAAHALRRQRATDLQANQSATARWDNVKDVFAVRSAAGVRGLRVLLVDDVLTTGATCHYAARALSQAGAAQVHAAVVAHR